MANDVNQLSSLSKEKLDSLSNSELATRMDLFLASARVENYGNLAPLLDSFHKWSTCDFLSTKTVAALNSSELQRKALYAAFEFILQIEFLLIEGGATNKLLFENFLYKTKQFESATIQLRFGALRQWAIVMSRIAFEKFGDLIFILETGDRVDAKSKFGKIRDLLSNSAKPWCYFAPYLIAVRNFDDNYRTPEVHKGSPIPRKLLLLLTPSSDELNTPNQLFNIMLNVWSPFLLLLNHQRPNTFFGGISDNEWIQAYSSGDSSQIDAWIKKHGIEMK